MSEKPRPIGEPLAFRVLLDEAIRRARPRFMRIYPAVAIPCALVQCSFPIAQAVWFRNAFSRTSPRVPNPAWMIGFFGAFAAVFLLFLSVYALGNAALMTSAVDAVADREISMGRAWRFVVRPRVLWTMFLSGVAATLGMLFCILPGIYLGLVLSLTLPVMADEALFGTAALKRSNELARYNPGRSWGSDPRLRVFLILFVGALLSMAVNTVVQLPIMIAQQLFMMRRIMGGQHPDPAAMMSMMAWFQVPSGFLTGLVSTAVNLYTSFGIALLFFDVKARKEGLDLEEAISRLVASRRAMPPPA